MIFELVLITPNACICVEMNQTDSYSLWFNYHYVRQCKIKNTTISTSYTEIYVIV